MIPVRRDTRRTGRRRRPKPEGTRRRSRLFSGSAAPTRGVLWVTPSLGWRPTAADASDLGSVAPRTRVLHRTKRTRDRSKGSDAQRLPARRPRQRGRTPPIWKLPRTFSYDSAWCTHRLPRYGTSQTRRGVENPGRHPIIDCCSDCACCRGTRQCCAPHTTSHVRLDAPSSNARSFVVRTGGRYTPIHQPTRVAWEIRYVLSPDDKCRRSSIRQRPTAHVLDVWRAVLDCADAIDQVYRHSGSQTLGAVYVGRSRGVAMERLKGFFYQTKRACLAASGGAHPPDEFAFVVPVGATQNPSFVEQFTLTHRAGADSSSPATAPSAFDRPLQRGLSAARNLQKRPDSSAPPR